MNVFLPIVSCLFFLQPSPPKSFCRYWDKSLFSFSDSISCLDDTNPFPNHFYTHSCRLSQGHPAARFSFTFHHPSLSDTNLLSSLSSEEACHTLDSLCYSNCSHVKFIDSASQSYFSEVLPGLLPGWLSSFLLHLTALIQYPMTIKQQCVVRGTAAGFGRCALFLLKMEIFQCDLVCRWREDTWFPRKQIRAPVTWRTICNRKC